MRNKESIHSGLKTLSHHSFTAFLSPPPPLLCFPFSFINVNSPLLLVVIIKESTIITSCSHKTIEYSKRSSGLSFPRLLSFLFIPTSSFSYCSFLLYLHKLPSSTFISLHFLFLLYVHNFILFLKWQPNHLHLLLLVSSNWRNSSPVLCVLTTIPTLRLYLVYIHSVRTVWRDYLWIRRMRPITSLVPLVVIVQSYQKKEQEPFL